MAIVTEISWDDMLAGKSLPESPVRQAWRTAVAEIAERAKATLPQCNGRIEKAVQIVLNGDVELLSEGKAKVASQSNGSTSYFLVNGTCECKDFAKAPSGWCKHRLAYGMYKRASALVKSKLDQYTSTETHRCETPLPEAPASVNVRLTLGGREVQITLRDTNEQHLLERLEKLLQRFPVEELKVGWCTHHNIQMKENHKNGQTWYSHKLANGKWCQGK
jgi:hypothetical protein